MRLCSVCKYLLCIWLDRSQGRPPADPRRPPPSPPPFFLLVPVIVQLHHLTSLHLQHIPSPLLSTNHAQHRHSHILSLIISLASTGPAALDPPTAHPSHPPPRGRAVTLSLSAAISVRFLKPARTEKRKEAARDTEGRKEEREGGKKSCDPTHPDSLATIPVEVDSQLLLDHRQALLNTLELPVSTHDDAPYSRADPGKGGHCVRAPPARTPSGNQGSAALLAHRRPVHRLILWIWPDSLPVPTLLGVRR